MRSTSAPEEKLAKATLTTQRRWRSKQRAKLHHSIFKQSPTTLANIPISSLDNPRMRNIVIELTAQRAIINSKIYHWTSESNLANITKSGAFYGNQLLQKYRIGFEKNSLVEADITNGDGNVICLCPYLVDPYLFRNKSHFYIFPRQNYRRNLVRLTLDLEKLPAGLKENNQFFKCYDLLAPPFTYEIKISDALTVTFIRHERDGDLDVQFSLNNAVSVTTLKKTDAMFYGNLSAINRFCLMTFFKLAQSIGSPFHKEDLTKYLASLNNDEMKKLLIAFCQGMTLYSEYNFNAILTLQDQLVTEVYFHEFQTTVATNSLTKDQYSKVYLFSNLYNKHIVNATPPLTIINHDKQQYSLQGLTIDVARVSAKHDIRAIPASEFASGNYLETREGCSILKAAVAAKPFTRI